MELKQITVTKTRLTDDEVLFYANLLQAGLNADDLTNPEKYVEHINTLAGRKYTTVDQVISVVPIFIAMMIEEDVRQQYRNLGL